jgi:phosphoglycolate phosphatase-like HAD superfamily hydrolase
VSNTTWIDADGYLFDIDGTVLNASGRAHYNAFTSAFKNIFGLTTTIDGVSWAGNTDVGIIKDVLEREGLSSAELDYKLRDVIEHMSQQVEDTRHLMRAALCPSVDVLLRRLHSRGKLLGVASGNFSRIGWAKLEVAGVKHFFSFGVFSDQFPTRSEIFRAGLELIRAERGEHARVCVVGDTPADIQAAKANYIPVVAVATGSYSFEELHSYSPDLCLRCCDEALPLETLH